jgi:hypothetical protein
MGRPERLASRQRAESAPTVGSKAPSDASATASATASTSRNVFAHLKRKGFTGIVGMEHGNARPGREGEQAVIEAYRAVDPASR